MSSGHRTVLAIRNRVDAGFGNTIRHQIIPRGIRAALAEGQVIRLGAALIGIAGHQDIHGRKFRKPSRLTTKRIFIIIAKL